MFYYNHVSICLHGIQNKIFQIPTFLKNFQKCSTFADFEPFCMKKLRPKNLVFLISILALERITKYYKFLTLEIYIKRVLFIAVFANVSGIKNVFLKL